MAELDANLAPYNFEQALAKDRADAENCFVLDVGLNGKGESVPSAKHVEDIVQQYFLRFHDLKIPVSKLYIVGSWNLDPATKAELEESFREETYNEQVEFHKSEAKENEMSKAVEKIMELVAQMPMLKELTWISRFPIVPAVMEKLPPLTKLVLDLGQATKVYRDHLLLHKAYITPSEMNALQQQTQLKELRLFRMHDSFQALVWETVFRNKSEGGMCVVDLQMFAAPFIRTEGWRKADEINGLNPLHSLKEVAGEKDYKGVDGKGILHFPFGTGEYLDDFCMRKARKTAGINEAKPAPLFCLKLDGFVIDHLPFLNELSHLVLLTCGYKCVDAGLRAPTTALTVPDEWSKTVGNATARCVIQWPTWIGAFDDRGLTIPGKVDVPVKLSANPKVMSVNDFKQFRQESLTVEALELKETIEQIKTGLWGSNVDSGDETAVSNASTRGGTDVPDTPIIASSEGPQLPSDDIFDLSDDSEQPVVPVVRIDPALSPPSPEHVLADSQYTDHASSASQIEGEDNLFGSDLMRMPRM